MKFEVKIPAIGESINEVTIGQWLVDNGEQVEEDQVICEVESEKATVEITAEQSGIINLIAQNGDTVNIGSIIAEIDVSAAESTDVKGDSNNKSKKLEDVDKATVESKSKLETEKSIDIKVSPVAANMLKEAGISIEMVHGSGQGGKVLKTDALKAINDKTMSSDANETISKQTKERPKTDENIKTGFANRIERREKMTTLRKTISRRLLEAKHGTAMLTTMNEVNMSMIIELRKKFKDKFKEKYDVNLGFMSFFCKAVAIALKEFPVINAQIEEDEIIYYDYCDISIAVSTPKGLVVPVVRNVEKLSLAQIELKVAELAAKARDGKLTIEEMTGGTFSITNGGVFGSLISTPLINSPQSAILGMHTIQDRPVAKDGQVIIRPMMYIALSYDHRIIDGKESVSFLVRLKEILEDPIRMLLFI
jgi:2-oxoglutarate dehydrogenase E2 component (dihydrolipoamide succinyltransferase)